MGVVIFPLLQNLQAVPMSLGDGGGSQGPRGQGSFPNQATFSGRAPFPGSTCPLGIFLQTRKFQVQSGKRLFLAGLPIQLPVGVVPHVVRWTVVRWGRNAHPGGFLLLCVGWDMPGLVYKSYSFKIVLCLSI